MSYFHKKLERRTFSQDRYDILIKRQKAGEASMRDLDELDEIVNRDPDIRERVLRENFEEFAADDDAGQSDKPFEENAILAKPPKRNIWTQVKAFFGRVFTSQFRASLREYNALC